jgi:WD40 repeat protein
MYDVNGPLIMLMTLLILLPTILLSCCCAVTIWDATSGDYLQTLEGHSDCVQSVAFHQGSTLLASAS